MLNLRFKNPYRIDGDDEEDIESTSGSFKFGQDLIIYEFDRRKELAPKGKACI
jgi:hypothetical protein